MTQSTYDTGKYISSWTNTVKHYRHKAGKEQREVDKEFMTSESDSFGYAGDDLCYNFYLSLSELPAPLYNTTKSCTKRMLTTKHLPHIEQLAKKLSQRKTNAKMSHKELMKYAAFMYFLEDANLFDIVEEKCEDKLWVYSTDDGYKIDSVEQTSISPDCRTVVHVPKIFKVEGKIMQGRSVIVFHGNLYGKKVAVKWSHSRDITTEYDLYVQLTKLGCKLPWVDRYYILGQPVLVLQHLRPIDRKDNAYYIGMKVLEQLAIIHLLGCHSDIKPQNILMEEKANKRVTFEGDTQQPDQPYLIDLGGMTTEKLNNGFRRQIWTGAYTAQRPHSKYQFTCAKFDFIELIFTMQAILLWQKSGKDVRLGYFKNEQIMGKFGDILHAAMRVADYLPDDHEKARLGWKELHKLFQKGYEKSLPKPVLLGLDMKPISSTL